MSGQASPLLLYNGDHDPYIRIANGHLFRALHTTSNVSFLPSFINLRHYSGKETQNPISAGTLNNAPATGTRRIKTTGFVSGASLGSNLKLLLRNTLVLPTNVPAHRSLVKKKPTNLLMPYRGRGVAVHRHGLPRKRMDFGPLQQQSGRERTIFFSPGQSCRSCGVERFRCGVDAVLHGAALRDVRAVIGYGALPHWIISKLQSFLPFGLRFSCLEPFRPAAHL